MKLLRKIIFKIIEYAAVILIFTFISSTMDLSGLISRLKTVSIKVPYNEVKVEYSLLSPLSLSIYNNENHIVRISINSNREVSGVIKVVFSGITVPYEQSFDVRGTEVFDVKPVLLPQAEALMNRASDVQFEIEVKNNAGKRLFVESKTVRMLSKNDMVWKLSDGTDISDYIASWVTPEGPEIKKLLRRSVDYLGRYPLYDTKKTDSRYVLNAVLGYQSPQNIDSSELILAQLSAIFDAIKDGYKVRYVSDIDTGRTDGAQYIKLPDEVLQEKSGLCIETVVTMASACEAAGLNCIIVLNDNHAILGVESSPGSKSYIFWETTDLTSSSEKAHKDGTEYFNKYKNSKNIKIVDIAKAREMGIRPLE